MALNQSSGIEIPGITASADLSSSQYYVVKFSGANTVALCDTAGEVAAGVLDNAPASGGVAKVIALGPAKVKLSGTVTRGGGLKAHTDGTARAAEATSVSGATVVGSNAFAKALESGVSGDIIWCLVVPNLVVTTAA